MNRRVTAGCPTCRHLQKRRVVRIPDENMPRGNVCSLYLRVTAHAKVGIIIDEQFLVDRTVRIVADRATLVHRFMLENKWPRLRLVALRTTLVLPRHRQSALRLEYVAAVRVVAIHTAHVAFDHRMMLWQVEFRLHVQMALKAGIRLFSRVDDEGRIAAGADMLAAGAVARFTAALSTHRRVLNMQARVRA